MLLFRDNKSKWTKIILAAHRQHVRSTLRRSAKFSNCIKTCTSMQHTLNIDTDLSASFGNLKSDNLQL